VRHVERWAEIEIDRRRLGEDVLSAAAFQCGATCVLSMVARERGAVFPSISVSRRGAAPEQRDLDRACADFGPEGCDWREYPAKRVRVFVPVGEAGPEDVVPLKRGKDGRLGVASCPETEPQ
jgi:hypothetical protein